MAACPLSLTPSTDPVWSANLMNKSNTSSAVKSPETLEVHDWLQHATSSWLTRNLQHELQ